MEQQGFLKKLIRLVFSKEFIMYGIMGVLATIVNWAVHALVVNHMIALVGNKSLGITITTIIAVIVSVIFAFFTNKIFVFESKSWEAKIFLKEFISFITARALTGVLEVLGVPFLVNIGLDQKLFGVEAMVAKVTVSFIVIILNYVFSKLFIFTHKSGK